MSANAVPRATHSLRRVPSASEEAWLAKRLGRALDLFLGTVTPRDRAERVRAVIIEKRVWDVVAGRRLGGSHETYGELFERLYGEPLFDQHQPQRGETQCQQ